jgi:hypothetical protein
LKRDRKLETNIDHQKLTPAGASLACRKRSAAARRARAKYSFPERSFFDGRAKLTR